MDSTTIEREIASAARFFGEACVPGRWTPDEQTDKDLSK